MIQAILPRRTQIVRKTSGRESAAQILATNIETVFLVTAADARSTSRGWNECSSWRMKAVRSRWSF